MPPSSYHCLAQVPDTMQLEMSDFSFRNLVAMELIEFDISPLYD